MFIKKHCLPALIGQTMFFDEHPWKRLWRDALITMCNDDTLW
jgi:hypothetical protein